MLSEIYVSGNSFVHRLRAGLKLLSLALVCTLVFIFDHWVVLSFALAMTVLGYMIARVPMRVAWQSFKPAYWMLVIIFLFQVIFQDFALACFIATRFLTMILAANLVTLTTKSAEIVEALEALFKRFLPAHLAEKISLAISLTLRFIPRVRQIYGEVQDAQRARGHGRSWRALATPLIIRTLKSADEIADAINARSGR